MRIGAMYSGHLCYSRGTRRFFTMPLFFSALLTKVARDSGADAGDNSAVARRICESGAGAAGTEGNG